MRAFEMPAEDLRLLRLTQVEPLLPAHPYVLYEFTIPQLTNRALHALRQQNGDGQSVYTGYRGAAGKHESFEQNYLEPLEAARLISGVYSHFLDPLRFSAANVHATERDAIFNGFGRALAGSRVLPSVETVAAHVTLLRSLDTFQDGLGTNVARWMQYLAYEALETSVARRGFTPGREMDRLRVALGQIRDSATVLDRFKALGRTSVHSAP